MGALTRIKESFGAFVRVPGVIERIKDITGLECGFVSHFLARVNVVALYQLGHAYDTYPYSTSAAKRFDDSVLSLNRFPPLH